MRPAQAVDSVQRHRNHVAERGTWEIRHRAREAADEEGRKRDHHQMVAVSDQSAERSQAASPRGSLLEDSRKRSKSSRRWQSRIGNRLLGTSLLSTTTHLL